VLRVYIAESLVDAQLMVDLLEQAGVPAELFNGNASGALGELPVIYPEVWIRRDLDENKAHRVVASFTTSFTAETGENISLRCSECGESSPHSFEICWQCHSPLPVL
jgi:hypothetical protein